MDPAAATLDARLQLPRFLRRHRGLTAFLLLLLLMLLLRLGWGWQADRQLRAMKADLRRQGHAVEMSDVVIPKVADAQNPLLIYSRAPIMTDSPRSSSMQYPSYPPYGKSWEAMAEASEKAHAATFSSIRGARSFPQAQIRSEFTIASIMTFGGFNRLRDLANHVVDGAEYQHLHGNEAEAIERLLDALHIAKAMRSDPTLISQLVAVGLDSQACAGVGHVAPAVRIDAAGAGGAATPAQIRKLIDVLLDDEELHRAMRDTIEAERTVGLEILRSEGERTWAMRPAAVRGQVRVLEDFEVNVRIAAADNAAEAKRAAAGYGPREQRASDDPFLAAGRRDHAPRYSRWFESGPRSLLRAIEQKFRALGERRAAAVILELQLYHADHNAWPDKLQALVPDYLPKLPTDPFYDDGRSIGYVVRKGDRPDGADRPMVYFDAGSTDDVWIDPEPMTGWQVEMNRPGGRRQRDVRQYRDATFWVPNVRRDAKLAAQPTPVGPRRRPTTAQSEAKTVDDDPDEADAPGDYAKPGGAGKQPPQQ